MSYITRKVILVGDAGVGKTTFIKRHRTGEFEKRYIATIAAEVHKLKFHTNNGTIVFDLWDCAGDDRFAGLGEGYYTGADAAIIMFDVTNKNSYKNLDKWYQSIKKKRGYIPIVICGNKVEIDTHKMKPREINFHRKKSLQYYNLSAKSNYHFDAPFLYLARRLFMNKELKFISYPDLSPPETPFSERLSNSI